MTTISITKEVSVFASIAGYAQDNENVLNQEIRLYLTPKQCVTCPNDGFYPCITLSYSHYKIHARWTYFERLPMNNIKGVKESEKFMYTVNPSILKIVDMNTGKSVSCSNVFDEDGEAVCIDLTLKLKCTARQSVTSSYDGLFEDAYKEARKDSAYWANYTKRTKWWNEWYKEWYKNHY